MIYSQNDPILMQQLISFVENALPTKDIIFGLGPWMILYTVGSAFLVGYLKSQFRINTAYSRKIFHLLIFTAAFFLQVAYGLPSVVVFGTIVSLSVLYAVLRGGRNAFYEAMARPRDSPKRALFIIIPLITTALGGLLSNIFFHQFAAIGYLVGGLGDAIGEPVGARFGKNWYKVSSLGGVKARRSFEGSAAVAMVSALAAFGGLHFLPLNGQLLLNSILIGVAAMLVEAFSTHGLDNLTIQLAASGMAYALYASY